MGGQQSSTKRLLVIGLDKAGKTALVHNIIQEPHDALHPTQGLKINFTRRDKLRIALWELPGLPKFRPQWQGYYDGVDVMIFVVDSANAKRLTEAYLTLRTVLHSPVLTGVPLLVFANKYDRRNKRTPAQIIQQMKLGEIRDRHWYIQACSAKTGYGIDAGLEWVLTELKKGKLAINARAVTARHVSRRHRDMLAEMVEAFNGKNLLTLRDIQLRFEKQSGVLYAASSLIVALEERAIPWKHSDMPDQEEIQARQLLREEKQRELQERIMMTKPNKALIDAAAELDGLFPTSLPQGSDAKIRNADKGENLNFENGSMDAEW